MKTLRTFSTQIAVVGVRNDRPPRLRLPRGVGRAVRASGRAALREEALDASDPASVARGLDGCSVVVNCADYRLNLPVMQGALAADVHYVDLGGSTTSRASSSGSTGSSGRQGGAGCSGWALRPARRTC